MSRGAKLFIIVLTSAFVLSVLAGGIHLFSREEVTRISDPSGRYTAVVTKRRYQSFVSRMPGQGSDAPGFVEIFGPSGESRGRVPLQMVQFAYQLRWGSSRAEIPLVAEWDFTRRTCYYWSEDQARQIWVRH